MASSSSGNDTNAAGCNSNNNKGVVCDLGNDNKNPCWTSNEKDGNILTIEGTKAQLKLEVIATEKQENSLHDSEGHKSPQSSQNLPLASQQAIPLEYNKIINHDKPNKLSQILSVFDNFDKINEQDAVRKDKKIFNFSSNISHEVFKRLRQEIVKHPLAGPSRDPKKKLFKKSPSIDSDDSVEEIKSITTCILENTLNKIESKDEERLRGSLIQDLREIIEVDVGVEYSEPQVNVENANNDDVEAETSQEVPKNPTEVVEQNNPDVNELVQDLLREELLQRIQENCEEDIEEDPEVEHSSREALFDANSQVDMLDDYDIDDTTMSGIAIQNDCIIVPDSNHFPENIGLHSAFPSWLLEMFQEPEAVTPEEDMHDEPHFYCQGDGLGVHPSTVAVNEDDEDDDDDDGGNESGSDTSSNSGSVDFANAEPSHSIQEMFMTANPAQNEDSLVVVGQSVPVMDQTDSAMASDEDEVFENAEDSESNLMVTPFIP